MQHYRYDQEQAVNRVELRGSRIRVGRDCNLHLLDQPEGERKGNECDETPQTQLSGCDEQQGDPVRGEHEEAVEFDGPFFPEYRCEGADACACIGGKVPDVIRKKNEGYQDTDRKRSAVRRMSRAEHSRRRSP